jgi:hypothetical protein
MKKILYTFFIVFLSARLLAQSADNNLSDSVYASGKIYVVVACIVVILLGLLIYLFSIDKRLKKVEKKSNL